MNVGNLIRKNLNKSIIAVKDDLVLGDKDRIAKEKESKRYTSEFSDDLILR